MKTTYFKKKLYQIKMWHDFKPVSKKKNPNKYITLINKSCCFCLLVPLKTNRDTLKKKSQ
jgi:hypothetical protein